MLTLFSIQLRCYCLCLSLLLLLICGRVIQPSSFEIQVRWKHRIKKGHQMLNGWITTLLQTVHDQVKIRCRRRVIFLEHGYKCRTRALCSTPLVTSRLCSGFQCPNQPICQAPCGGLEDGECIHHNSFTYQGVSLNGYASPGDCTMPSVSLFTGIRSRCLIGLD